MILPPPWASMCRASCWQHMKTPRVLTPNVASNSAIGVSSAAEFLLMPALLTATCKPPSRSTAVATIAATSASSATFARCARPVPPLTASSATTASARARSRSTTITAAPASDRACAYARPMPWPAPVTSATLPSRRMRSRIRFPPTPRTTSSSSVSGAALAGAAATTAATEGGATDGPAGTSASGVGGSEACGMARGAEAARAPARRTMVMPSRIGRSTCSTRGSLATISLKAAMAEPPSFHASRSREASCRGRYAWPLKRVLSTTITPPSASRPGVVRAAS
mmetsp:Transcript_954/g.2878  ORF Transcript_954/g.2878 Transcript_954/m.2878 type:complete len:283 (-) Transcript_954:680-1528(-)